MPRTNLQKEVYFEATLAYKIKMFTCIEDQISDDPRPSSKAYGPSYWLDFKRPHRAVYNLWSEPPRSQLAAVPLSQHTVLAGLGIQLGFLRIHSSRFWSEWEGTKGNREQRRVETRGSAPDYLPSLSPKVKRCPAPQGTPGLFVYPVPDEVPSVIR